MANKVSKSDKIRALLAKGMSAKDVAKKVGVSAPYVYQVSWHDKQKKAEKKAAKSKAVKKTVKMQDVLRDLPSEQLLLPEIPAPSYFDPWEFVDTVQNTGTAELRKAQAFLTRELDRRQTA